MAWSQPERAAAWFGGAAGLRDEAGSQTGWATDDPNGRARVLDVARQHVREERFDVLWRAARAHPRACVQQVLTSAWPDSLPDRVTPMKRNQLTSREREIAALVVRGLSTSDIAAQLVVSARMIAILKFKKDEVAGVERGKDWTGIHHIGFQVESLADIASKLEAAGSRPRDDVNQALGVGQGQRHANVEVKYGGPDGVMVDDSETCWVGTSPLPARAELV